MSAQMASGADREPDVWALCAELRQRLLAGEECRAETYLDSYPTLASDAEQAVNLIYIEFRTRQEMGQAPDPEEWLRRFPRWQDALQRQFSVMGWVGGITSVPEATGASHRTEPHAVEVAADPAPPFPDLREHEILGELGRGGMGVVYRARDPVLDRTVALKILGVSDDLAGPWIDRFYREARAVARLRHPNVVPIHGVGLHRGRHAFTMDLITGGTLARRIGEFRQDHRRAVALMAKVARAVDAAHQAGIIHRDLKPANILLDGGGEPMVNDFGLARFLDAGGDVTLPGTVLGTPAYMSPEQASGEGRAATVASDVWSLGVILYEILAGRRPFEGKAGQLLEQVKAANPPPPRRVNPRLDRDLEAVVLGCLEPEPARRYPSAEALAEDLERWLRGEPVHSEAGRWSRRLGRLWKRRLRRPALVSLLLLAVLLPSLALLVRYLAPVPPLRPSAEEERAREQREWLAGLEGDLQEGRKVTLVGETGIPRYYRWWTEKDRGPLVPRGHIPLYVEAHERSYIELLPRVPTDSYLFSGEVQIAATRRGVVGLYVAGEKVRIGEVEEYRTCEAAFTDRHVPGPHLSFGPCLHRPWPARDEGPRRVTFFRDGKAKGLGTAGQWHAVALRVTPEGFRLLWEGEEVFAMKREAFDRFVRALGVGPQPLNRDFGPVPTFSPQGSLGLLVYDAEARFRNVTVQPLNTP